jgi:hypothetical protein
MRWLDPAWWNDLREEYPDRFAVCCGVAVAALGLGGYATVATLGGGGASSGDYGLMGPHSAAAQPALGQPHSSSLFTAPFALAASPLSEGRAGTFRTDTLETALGLGVVAMGSPQSGLSGQNGTDSASPSPTDSPVTGNPATSEPPSGTSVAVTTTQSSPGATTTVRAGTTTTTRAGTTTTTTAAATTTTQSGVTVTTPVVTVTVPLPPPPPLP